ncbi:hypothetical protein Tco_0946082 [Tanacetum coccineum]
MENEGDSSERVELAVKIDNLKVRIKQSSVVDVNRSVGAQPRRAIRVLQNPNSGFDRSRVSDGLMHDTMDSLHVVGDQIGVTFYAEQQLRMWRILRKLFGLLRLLERNSTPISFDAFPPLTEVTRIKSKPTAVGQSNSTVTSINRTACSSPYRSRPTTGLMAAWASKNPSVGMDSNKVSLTTVGDLEVLIKDIDAGKHKELLSGMTNDKRRVVIDALGVMCDLIKVVSASNASYPDVRNASSDPGNMHTSSLVEDVLIHSIYDVATLFGVPLNSPKEIDEFTKDLEVGKYDLWLELTKETRSRIIDIICDRWDTLLNMQKSAPIVDDSLSGKVSPIDPIV